MNYSFKEQQNNKYSMLVPGIRSGRSYAHAMEAKYFLTRFPNKKVWVSCVRQIDLLVNIGIKPSQIVLKGEEMYTMRMEYSIPPVTLS